jgi:flagellar motor switch protein FliN/FliY
MVNKDNTGEQHNNEPKPAVEQTASGIDPQEKSSKESAKNDNGAPAQPAQSEPTDVNTKKAAAAHKPKENPESVDLNVILDIPLEITVELGRTQMPIHELLNLGPGSAVALSGLEGEPVDILANNTLIARGIVLVKNNRYGIRITEITSHLDRIKSLS